MAPRYTTGIFRTRIMKMISHMADALQCTESPGEPKPPPPGVSIVTRSPGTRSRVTFAGSSSPFSRLQPRAPGSPQRPHDALTAAEAAVAAGTEPERVPLDPERIRELERLNRRRERVRHRDVYRRRAVSVRTGALAAADRLVVSERVAPEGEVVH